MAKFPVPGAKWDSHFGKAVNKAIPPKTLESFADRASRLEKALDALLVMLKTGQWDELGDLESTLLPALLNVAASGKLTINQVDRNELQQLLQKLEFTIAECNARKEQISPLLNTLSNIKAKRSS